MNDLSSVIHDVREVTPETLESAEYAVVELGRAIENIERHLLKPSGREELGRDVVELTELDARLHAIAFVLRPRVEKAA